MSGPAPRVGSWGPDASEPQPSRLPSWVAHVCSRCNVRFHQCQDLSAVSKFLQMLQHACPQLVTSAATSILFFACRGWSLDERISGQRPRFRTFCRVDIKSLTIRIATFTTSVASSRWSLATETEGVSGEGGEREANEERRGREAEDEEEERPRKKTTSRRRRS